MGFGELGSNIDLLNPPSFRYMFIISLFDIFWFLKIVKSKSREDLLLLNLSLLLSNH